MRYLLIISILFAVTINLHAQKTIPYQLFDAKGKKTTFEKMLSQSAKADIILFGEEHNNPIAHWLQLELTKGLLNTKPLILSAEMFEADNQEVLNQYLADTIDDKGLDSLARLWKNYKTDYKPLVTIAKENKLPFVAANIPRKFASKVYKSGFEALDSLTNEEKKWIAPLPIVYDSLLACYADILKESDGHGGANLPKAQAVKDATMAYFILRNYKTGSLCIHYNGSYHSDNYQSILWYLTRTKPELKYLTISTVSQKDPSKLDKENLEKADFIICVDEDMTKTF
ncbi:MAG: ChaN family lipoprotein [Salinivirgaceae bacterium]